MQKNKLLKIILSAVIAFGLWLYVITVVSPGSEKTVQDIPVQLQNQDILADRDLIVTDYDDKVTLQLEGNRIDLNELDASDINFYADVSTITGAGERQSVKCSVSLPSGIVEKGRTPGSLTVNVERLVTKTVKVEYEADGVLPVSYHPETPVYKVNGEAVKEITVSGPESMVSQMEYAMVYVDFDQRVDSVFDDYEFVLCDADRQRVDTNPELITVNAETVHVDIKIYRIVELPLAVELISGGGATEENCEVTFGPIDKLTVSGSDAVMGDLESIVIGSVDLSQIREDTTLTLPLQMPKGVTNRTEGYEEVEVQIKLKNLQTKSLQVSQFRVTNKPQGMSYEGIPTSVTVQVRGPSQQIAKIQPSDVTIVLDLSKAQLGVNPVQAVIEIDKAFADVGALDDYEIMVSVRQQ